MKRNFVLYRAPSDISFENELTAIKKYFPCSNSRLDIQVGDLVIGRYSVLPFFKEQERDIEKIGATLINSFYQHNYVADLKNYYDDLKDFTPKTWFRPVDIPIDEPGSFVLKGQTNSKKFLWNTHMFAPTRADVMDVFCRLQDDTMIGSQDIYIRKYVPLYKYLISERELPITKEFRFFIAYKKVVSGGFYWSNFADEIKVPSSEEVPKGFLDKIIEIIGDNINFYALDIAQTESGNWIVIELNDGMMSGLSENNPDILYKKLSGVL